MTLWVLQELVTREHFESCRLFHSVVCDHYNSLSRLMILDCWGSFAEREDPRMRPLPFKRSHTLPVRWKHTPESMCGRPILEHNASRASHAFDGCLCSHHEFSKSTTMEEISLKIEVHTASSLGSNITGLEKLFLVFLLEDSFQNTWDSCMGMDLVPMTSTKTTRTTSQNQQCWDLNPYSPMSLTLRLRDVGSTLRENLRNRIGTVYNGITSVRHWPINSGVNNEGFPNHPPFKQM